MKTFHARTAIFATLLVVFALLLLPFLPRGVAAAAPPADALDVAALDTFVREQVERQGIPGLALAVVDGDQIVHMAGYGRADQSGRPVTPQTPFVLASVSKPITALAVMQLVEAGALELDASVQRYLPDFRVADPAASGQITVRHLLNHTSGVPEWGCITRKDSTTLEQFVAEWQTIELATPPGTKHYYCSGNYNVLGRIVEVVTGQPFGSYIEQHVFAPLRMEHSSTSKQEARADGLAQGHRLFFGVAMPFEYDNPSALPAGFLISSAEDMSHFLIAQLNGGSFSGTSVLSPEGVAAMQAPSVEIGPGQAYGLGWRLKPIGGVQAISHSGDHPHIHNLLFIQPESRRGVVLLINMNNIPAALTALPELEDGVARLLAGQSPAPPAMPLPRLYLIIDLVLGGLFALALLPLLWMRRWAQRLRRRQAAGKLRPLWVGLRIACELLFPLALVVGMQQLLGAPFGATSWSEIWLLLPDLGLWPWAVAIPILLAGVLRLALLLHALRGDMRPAA